MKWILYVIFYRLEKWGSEKLTCPSVTFASGDAKLESFKFKICAFNSYVTLSRLGSKREKDRTIEGEVPFSKFTAAFLPAGIKPSGSCARTGVRMLSVSMPAFFWALRSKACATSLADPSPPTQTILESKKLSKRMQDFKMINNNEIYTSE